MRLLLATRSLPKAREARELLAEAGIELVGLDEIGLEPHADEEHLEIGATFSENAVAKARHFASRSGLATIADDSGLEVDALNGSPGVHSKRWARATGTDADLDRANNEHLLTLLSGKPETDRRACYRCVLALVEPGSDRILLAEGTVVGRIMEEPHGTGGFGYDPLFWSEELGKTFGEASADEKNRVSHRARAYAMLVRQLRSHLQPNRS